MSLVHTISDIASKLRQSKFPNEQSISQGIVLRVLQALNWDAWDSEVVWPEYQTGQGRADFALCHPARKPIAFIEVKQPGKAEEGVRQALEYAFHMGGVPFAILTDGRTWSFYLPTEQGSYEDRRVYKLDLCERPPEECATVLERYLSNSRVVSGLAVECARREYRSQHGRTQARLAIPGVWQDLVEKGDEDLVEIVSSAVELKTGIKPDSDSVAEFLAGLSQQTAACRPHDTSQRWQASQNRARLPLVSHRTNTESSRSGSLTLLGTNFEYANAKEAMVIVLTELAQRDPDFLERCAQHPDVQGRKRRYIARSSAELYPDRDDLRDLKASLPGGWLVATNLNNVLKRTIIKLAAETAKLTFGRDVIVTL